MTDETRAELAQINADIAKARLDLVNLGSVHDALVNRKRDLLNAYAESCRRPQ